MSTKASVIVPALPSIDRRESCRLGLIAGPAGLRCSDRMVGRSHPPEDRIPPKDISVINPSGRCLFLVAGANAQCQETPVRGSPHYRVVGLFGSQYGGAGRTSGAERGSSNAALDRVAVCTWA